MGRGATIALLVIPISGQVPSLWALRQVHPHLTARPSAALWSMRILMIVTSLSGGLSLIAPRIESPLEIIFILSFGAWVASVLWLWSATFRSMIYERHFG
jgi:hypothetical protein